MDNWPLCRPGQVHVKNPKHPVAILTCWTKKTFVIKELDQLGADYNSVGQFYTVRGFSPLIRNLLANPRIFYIAITGHDLGNMIQKLYESWAVSEKSFPGCEDIPIDLQNELRLKVFLIKFEHVSSIFAFTVDGESHFNNLKEERMCCPFPEPESNITSFPSADFGHCVTGRTIPETYLKMLQYILRFGVETNTHYEDPQKEVLAMQNVITAPPILWSFGTENLYDPIPEWMPATTEHVSKYIAERILCGETYAELQYTYGELIHTFYAKGGEEELNQFEATVDKMVENSDQRSCVISLWDPMRHSQKKSGTPCLNHIQFRMRNNTLTMHAFIRSNDMYGGWPENAYAMRVLQEHFLKRYIEKLPEGADTLIKMGPLCITSMSAHLYKDTWEPAQELVDKYLDEFSLNPWEDFDPKGQFNVIHEDEKIIVELTKDDNVLQKWEGKYPRVLCNQIVKDIGTDNVSNAMWLARQLSAVGKHSNCEHMGEAPDEQCSSCDQFTFCWGVN